MSPTEKATQTAENDDDEDGKADDDDDGASKGHEALDGNRISANSGVTSNQKKRVN